MNPKLKHAKGLAESNPEEAMRLCNEVLNDSFDDQDAQIALFMIGYIMMSAEKYGLAYNIFKRCAELNPEQSEIYSNMGMCFEEADPIKALELFDKSYALNNKNTSAIANKALMYLHTGRPNQCIALCDHVLKLNPESKAAVHNRGLAKLMNRDMSGWSDYYSTLGVKHRERRDYGLPEWNGESGQVLVYGEQGVGDEVMFASCLPDLYKHNGIVFDCDKRLESLFKRTFDFPIYGTRFETQTPLLDNHTPDYQCAIGQLPYFFRKKGTDFPGTPYMKPDPDRVKQWDCLLDKDKPRIGIAWSGGSSNTGQKYRTASPDLYKDLIEKYDAEWVNLDYKPYEGDLPIKNWPRAVRKFCDLEDTFALIANLDLVITVCTSVVYFAGSQGIKTRVMVPDWPGYRYHISGLDFWWHDSVRLYRGNFESVIKREIERDVKDICRLRSKGVSSISCAKPFDNEKSAASG